ncbi:MAG TPA: DUF177 domain-containing protein [Stenomitos sp.]
MLIDVETLLQAQDKDTIVDFDEAVDFPADLGTLKRPLAGTVKIERSMDDRMLRLTGRLSTVVDLVCDRCLGPTPTEVAFDLDETLEVTETPSEALLVEDAIAATGDLDLSDLLRQNLLLHLPSRSLCGCEPAYLAEHKRIDPRWRQLEALLNRTTEEESKTHGST